MWNRIAGLALLASLIACGSTWRQFEEPRQVHEVVAGETLYQIAFAYRLDPAALAQWNGIGRDARIFAGQSLRLRPPLPGQLHPVHGGALASARRAEPVAAASPSAPPSTSSSGPPSRPVVSAPAPTPVVTAPPVLAARPLPPTGAWQWPVEGPVLRGFDANNAGLDIGVPSGTSVRAIGNGRVVYGGSALKGYGLLVIVAHANDVMSAYGHTAALTVGEGDEVRAGQVIARSGLGPKQTPLLRLEVRRKGQPVDPLTVLPKR